MKLLSVAVFAGLFLVVSCRKDKVTPTTIENGTSGGYTTPPPPPDTSASRSYFPTYPGSYWIYDNGDTARTSDSYKLTKQWSTYVPNWWYPLDEPPTSTDVYSVEYHGVAPYSGIVREYTFYPSSYHGTTNPTFYEGGYAWTNYSTYQEVAENFWTVKVDSMMDILGSTVPVTIIKTHNDTHWADPEYNNNPGLWGREYYFAKDIGIVKIAYNSYPDTIPVVINLVEYFVND